MKHQIAPWTFVWRFLGFPLLFLALFYFLLTRVNTMTPGAKLPGMKLTDQYGEHWAIGDFQGKWVLVDFWFQGCAPCLAEMKQFPGLLDRYRDRMVILSISIDPPANTRRLLADKPGSWNFLRADDPDWRFSNDTGLNLTRELGIRQYPSYILIDPAGRWVSSPRSGVLGVQGRLGRFPNPMLYLTLLWDKLYALRAIALPLLLLWVAYEGVTLLRRRRQSTK